MAHPDPLPHKTDTDSDILEKITDNLGGDAKWIDSLQSKKALAAKSILGKLSELEARRDAEPIDSSKSYSEGEIVYAEGASWRVAAGGANAGDLPSTHPDKFVSFQEGVTSIANKEAAYALTGVAVGTVYKTEDTGQIMEYMGKRNAGISDVLYIDTDYLFNTLPAGDNPSLTVRGYYHRRPTKNNLDTRPSFVRDDGAILFSANGDVWDLGHNDGGGLYIHSEYNPDPTDIVGTSWNNYGGMSNHPQTIAFSDFPEMYPNNWKHDGVLLVNDNDEKQLLTNLPDDQQVKIVVEGGRIEQLPPSPLPDIKRGFIVSDAGNPRSSVSDGGYALSGAYFWHETDGQFVRDDNGSYYNAYFYHDGFRWQIGYQMGYFFQSDLCASTVHPADATGWTAYDAWGAGIGQGTIADGGLVKTRACEVYNSPQSKTSGNTPWFTIKNTVELTWHDDWYSGDQTINGILAPEGTPTNVGWVPVGERIQGTNASTDNFTWTTTVINGIGPNTQVFPKMVLLTDAGILIPDGFPSGAAITVKSS